MSPIRPEERARRCECEGECGGALHVAQVGALLANDIGADIRCLNRHGLPSIWSGALVVVTTAHLDPENGDPANLKAMCQECREHHAETRRSRTA